MISPDSTIEARISLTRLKAWDARVSFTRFVMSSFILVVKPPKAVLTVTTYYSTRSCAYPAAPNAEMISAIWSGPRVSMVISIAVSPRPTPW